MEFDVFNWLILYAILTILGVGNTYMVKYSANRLSWQENLTFSRIPIMFYDIYLIIKYFRFQYTTAHIVSFLSGILVIISLPFTYYLLRKLDISRLYPLGAISTGLICILGFLAFKEKVSIMRLAGIILAIGSFYLLSRGK